MTDARTINDAMVGLLPDGIAVVVSNPCPTDARLEGPERDAARHMVAKRRREFTHGRHCARQALQQLGAPPSPIPKGPDRAPQWPSDIVGSISHTGTLAAAAVARRSAFAGVGLDIEASGTLTPDTLTLILTPEERDTLDPADGRLVFSIKEAIYKCIYPQVGRYVDFQEMQVTLDKTRDRFVARPRLEHPVRGLPDSMMGRYQRTADYVLSVLWLAAPIDGQ